MLSSTDIGLGNFEQRSARGVLAAPPLRLAGWTARPRRESHPQMEQTHQLSADSTLQSRESVKSAEQGLGLSLEPGKGSENPTYGLRNLFEQIS